MAGFELQKLEFQLLTPFDNNGIISKSRLRKRINWIRFCFNVKKLSLEHLKLFIRFVRASEIEIYMGFIVRALSLFFTKVKSPFAYELFYRTFEWVMRRFPPVGGNISPTVSNKRENILPRTEKCFECCADASDSTFYCSGGFYLTPIRSMYRTVAQPGRVTKHASIPRASNSTWITQGRLKVEKPAIKPTRNIALLVK